MTDLNRPLGFQQVEAPKFQYNRHLKVVMLSALRTGRLYDPVNIPSTHFCQKLSQPQGHGAAGRIMSMKKSIDTTGNRTRDIPACSAVGYIYIYMYIYYFKVVYFKAWVWSAQPKHVAYIDKTKKVVLWLPAVRLSIRRFFCSRCQVLGCVFA